MCIRDSAAPAVATEQASSGRSPALEASGEPSGAPSPGEPTGPGTSGGAPGPAAQRSVQATE
eukprot:2697042-Alexandrium_andersonii.AAC.1